MHAPSFPTIQYGVKDWGMYEERLRQTGLVGDREAAMAHMQVSKGKERWVQCQSCIPRCALTLHAHHTQARGNVPLPEGWGKSGGRQATK
jgi:hypothetical protein